MNVVTAIPATVNAEISGIGSFFGSCQIASGNFEAALQGASNRPSKDFSSFNAHEVQSIPSVHIENANQQDSNLAINDSSLEQNLLQFFMQSREESEVMDQLKAILGDDVSTEDFKRIISLLEKGSLSVHKDMDNLKKEDFIDLSKSLLDRLNLAIKEIEYTFNSDEQNLVTEEMPLQGISLALQGVSLDNEKYDNESYNKEIVLNLLGDLLKASLITPHEFEQVTQNIENNDIIQLLNELKEDTDKFLLALVNTVENTYKNYEVNSNAFNYDLTEEPDYINNEAILKLFNEITEKSDFKVIDSENVENDDRNFEVQQAKGDSEIKQVSEDFVKNTDNIDTGKVKANTGNTEINYAEIKSAEVVGAEVKKSESKISEIKSPEIKSPEVVGKEIKHSEVKSAEVVGAEVKKSESKILEIKSPEIKSPETIGEETKHANTKGSEIKAVKAEPEVRVVWEGGDLKIETINPKTGEKLQSIPMSGSQRLQERINEFEVVRQVVAQAKLITTPNGEQRITMQLRPEHLGQMDLRITLNNGEMQINARVESATAQAALENHIGLLRESLEKQGINLERLEVSIEQRENREAYFNNEHENRRSGGKNGRRKKGQTSHLEISIAKNENSDTGRRLGYNTMEYLA